MSTDLLGILELQLSGDLPPFVPSSNGNGSTM